MVGAGPAGLLATRRLVEAGLDIVTLERNADVGGIWDIEAPGSPMYESAHFISSRTQSGFPGFPMPDSYPDYPDHRLVHAYIRQYADEHDLRRHIRFGTAVEHARQDTGGGWVLRLGDGSELRAGYLVCANGVTWEPNVVTWPGDFDGEVLHSRDYRSPAQLAGKRVLVVGAGNSGVDIACDAAFAADKAFLSVRRGYHFLPKHVLGVPTDVLSARGPRIPHRLLQMLVTGLLKVVTGDLTRYGLPRPDHRVLDSHPLMNTQVLHYLAHGACVAKGDVASFDGPEVVFRDGSRERIDLVISATGYQARVPFVDDDVLPTSGGRLDLYLGVLPRETPGLAVMGYLEFASAAYRVFDDMAALIVSDAAARPGSPERRTLDELRATHRPDVRGGHRYIDSPRHANYVDVDAYTAALASVQRRVSRPVAA